jgi:hypothetical protein
MRKLYAGLAVVLLSGMMLVSGCSTNSYPAEKIKDALLEICRQEYGIEDIDVKVIGQTIGVYLPLKKLFAADFKEAAVTGKVRNLETLFEPSPEALEKVEDVLFSISRVILSTDRDLKFYVLQATDTEKTGMQLVLSGYVNDIKRVRVWDISRNEYRKRVIHELRLNRAVMWHRPVRRFFKDLETQPLEQIQKKYFGETLPPDAIQSLFFNALLPESVQGPRRKWEILDVRSAPIQKNEILVYAKVRTDIQELEKKGNELQYLFLLSLNEEDARIVRIIPFQYKDELDQIKHIPFPKELQIEDNLDHWEQEFPLEEVKLGPFLAQQLTRRVQSLIAGDERIQNTFREVKLEFEFNDKPGEPSFSLNLEAILRDFNNYTRTSLVFHEDMLYLLNLTSREFVDLLRSYHYVEFDFLRLNVAQEPTQWILGRDDLELFRRKRLDLQGLLSVPKI